MFQNVHTLLLPTCIVFLHSVYTQDFAQTHKGHFNVTSSYVTLRLAGVIFTESSLGPLTME